MWGHVNVCAHEVGPGPGHTAPVMCGNSGDGVVETQGWPDVMAAVVRDVWELVMCLLGPGCIWGAV